jgi:hypothetical protein
MTYAFLPSPIIAIAEGIAVAVDVEPEVDPDLSPLPLDTTLE